MLFWLISSFSSILHLVFNSVFFYHCCCHFKLLSCSISSFKMNMKSFYRNYSSYPNNIDRSESDKGPHDHLKFHSTQPNLSGDCVPGATSCDIHVSFNLNPLSSAISDVVWQDESWFCQLACYSRAKIITPLHRPDKAYNTKGKSSEN